MPACGILTDVGLLQGRRVVDAVTGDRDDGALTLTALNDDELLLRRCSSEDDLGVFGQN